MKVVIINTSERTGGAAVAAGRLAKALFRNGVSVNMLVREKQSADSDVVSVNTNAIIRFANLFRFYWERLVIFLFNHLNRKDLFCVSIANVGKDISRHPLVSNADIIHLHWVNQGFLSMQDIRKLVESGNRLSGLCMICGLVPVFVIMLRNVRNIKRNVVLVFFFIQKVVKIFQLMFLRRRSKYIIKQIFLLLVAVIGWLIVRDKVDYFMVNLYCLFLIRWI